MHRSLIVPSKSNSGPDYMSRARLARLAGLLRYAEMIFRPVLHEAYQAG